jgi:cytochrome c oxidase subunit III
VDQGFSQKQGTMPGTKQVEEIELIIEDIGGGGGGEPPAGGDGGGDGDKRRRPGPASPRRYYTAITLALVSILIFFMALSSAFLVRRMGSDWIPVHLPAMIWVNTIVLLASSATMELARKRLAAADLEGFRRLWQVTTGLGVFFLVGQLVAWRELVAQGVYVASNPGSSFFYIFTAAHGLHLLGGVCALLYVLYRAVEKTNVSRSLAAEVASYYWHFMDGLWVFLLALLYLGK